MPSQTLRDLARHLNPQIPNLIGAAQTRLGENPAFILPNDQYETVRGQLDQPETTTGFTISPPASLADKFIMNFLPFLRSAPIVRTASQNPTVVTSQRSAPQNLRHEAIHAYLDDFKGPNLTPEQAINLIGPRGYAGLSHLGYNSDQILDAGGEIPARLTTNPWSLDLSPQEGREAMVKYISILRQQNPGKAARLEKYLQIGPPPRDEKSFQKPNEVF